MYRIDILFSNNVRYMVVMVYRMRKDSIDITNNVTLEQSIKQMWHLNEI